MGMADGGHGFGELSGPEGESRVGRDLEAGGQLVFLAIRGRPSQMPVRRDARGCEVSGAQGWELGV